MISTQLRCSASFLNNDLYKSNILSNLNCACGVDIRRNLLICVNRFGMNIDLALLTRGNQNLTHEDNCLICKEVYKFIRRSKRFLII
jgi:hypothetical protein